MTPADEISTSRRTFSLRTGSLLLGALTMHLRAAAAAYPGRGPVKLVAGASPGTVTDALARALSENLAAAFHVPVIVENKAGGSGIIAAQAVMAAPPDGLTLFVQGTPHTVTPFAMRLNFDPIREFSGVAPLGVMSNVLVASPSATFKSIAELIALGKAKPRTLNYGSAGLGSASHFAAAKFLLAAGFEAEHVPFKNAGDAITETLARRIDWVLALPAPGLVQMVRAGQLRALAVTSSARSPLFPEVPTLSEAGVRDAESVFWIGLLASSRTPPDILTTLNSATIAAVQSEPLRTRLRDVGAEPMPLTPKQFDDHIRNEFATNARIAKAAGISVPDK